MDNDGGDDDPEKMEMLPSENDDQPQYDYDKAIKSTIDYRRPCMGKFFQILILFVSIMAINASNFVILGLPLMKSEP